MVSLRAHGGDSDFSLVELITLRDGTHASAAKYGLIRIWSPRFDRLLASSKKSYDSKPYYNAEALVELGEECIQLATCYCTSSVHIWQRIYGGDGTTVDEIRNVRDIETDIWSVNDIYVLEDWTTLVTIPFWQEETVKLWNSNDGTLVSKLDSSEYFTNSRVNLLELPSISIEPSSNPSSLLMTVTNRGCQLWDWRSGVGFDCLIDEPSKHLLGAKRIERFRDGTVAACSSSIWTRWKVEIHPTLDRSEGPNGTLSRDSVFHIRVDGL